jgi:large subunit ribosomal protein L9
MEVILLERIEKLGQMGDVVTVKPGFARNYLLPQKKALRATEENCTQFEQQRSQLEVANLEQRGEAEQVAGRIEGLKVVIVRQASDSDQLYGSVTVRNIAQAVTEAGFTIDSKQVQLTRPIKTVGLHDVRVVLHPEVAVNVVANVARSEEEAELQAAGKRVSAAGDDEDDEVPETDTEPAAGAVEGDDADPASTSEDPASEDPASEDEVRTEDGSG